MEAAKTAEEQITKTGEMAYNQVIMVILIIVIMMMMVVMILRLFFSNTDLSDCELPWKRPHGGVPWIEKQRGTDRLYVQTRGIQTPFAGVVD